MRNEKWPDVERGQTRGGASSWHVSGDNLAWLQPRFIQHVSWTGWQGYVGEGHRQAAKRRAWAKNEEERMKEKRREYWHANIRSRGFRRAEFAVL